MADSVGEQDLRKEYIDTIVKAVALAEYKLITLCTKTSANAWTESYYRETNTELTGGTGSAVKGIPRLAPFPSAQVNFTKVSSIIDKYGLEGLIPYEDEILDNIPVTQRTILRIGRGVSYSIDVEIEARISADYGNTFAITAGNEWDSATVANRDPVYDILYGINMLRADNIEAIGKGYLVLNGTDYTNVINNDKVIKNPTFKMYDVVANGVVGQLCGLKIMVTDAITADTAYIIVDKEAMTWKDTVPLTVVQKVDEGISRLVRAFQLGVCQVQVPNGVCKITNTRA